MQADTRAADSAFGRFYTSIPVVEALIQSMKSQPDRIVDLGSGSGFLAFAALRRWRAKELVTVDIDRISRPIFKSENRLRPSYRHTHVMADVLDVDLPARLPIGRRKFDAAVCNPPYVTPPWRPGFERILEEAGLASVLKQQQMIGADVLFIAQNLRLIEDGGEIGLIVPDGIITGRTSASLRLALINGHCIDRVVQLPRGCFRRTEAQAFILVFRKSRRQSEKIRLASLGLDGELSSPLFIDAHLAEERCDFVHYANPPIRRKASFTLRDAGAHIVRGSLHSGEAKHSGYAYFHTTHFPGTGSKILNFRARVPSRGGRKLAIAEAGDILIARVDRRLHTKVGFVASGRAVFTDCIFRIRVPPAWRKRVFRALNSRRGAQALEAAARGVGARMLTKDDLFQMRLS
jgi:type I restriction enzyme M protein